MHEKVDKNKEELGMVEEDFGSEQMTAAETNAWSQLQKYKSRCNDYYWNDDGEYNKALPMALAIPKPSIY